VLVRFRPEAPAGSPR